MAHAPPNDSNTAIVDPPVLVPFNPVTHALEQAGPVLVPFNPMTHTLEQAGPNLVPFNPVTPALAPSSPNLAPPTPSTTNVSASGLPAYSNSNSNTTTPTNTITSTAKAVPSQKDAPAPKVPAPVATATTSATDGKPKASGGDPATSAPETLPKPFNTNSGGSGSGMGNTLSPATPLPAVGNLNIGVQAPATDKTKPSTMSTMFTPPNVASQGLGKNDTATQVPSNVTPVSSIGNPGLGGSPQVKDPGNPSFAPLAFVPSNTISQAPANITASQVPINANLPTTPILSTSATAAPSQSAASALKPAPPPSQTVTSNLDNNSAVPQPALSTPAAKAPALSAVPTQEWTVPDVSKAYRDIHPRRDGIYAQQNPELISYTAEGPDPGNTRDRWKCIIHFLLNCEEQHYRLCNEASERGDMKADVNYSDIPDKGGAQFIDVPGKGPTAFYAAASYKKSGRDNPPRKPFANNPQLEEAYQKCGKDNPVPDPVYGAWAKYHGDSIQRTPGKHHTNGRCCGEYRIPQIHHPSRRMSLLRPGRCGFHHRTTLTCSPSYQTEAISMNNSGLVGGITGVISHLNISKESRADPKKTKWYEHKSENSYYTFSIPFFFKVYPPCKGDSSLGQEREDGATFGCL